MNRMISVQLHDDSVSQLNPILIQRFRIIPCKEIRVHSHNAKAQLLIERQRVEAYATSAYAKRTQRSVFENVPEQGGGQSAPSEILVHGNVK